jgi:RNA polymerase primary sigma factor
MIIDDLRLSDAGASNVRDGYAADGLGPDLHELEQIHVEAEAEPTAPSPTADHTDTGIDSPLGIYFRDIARIPLLTAEQEVDLAQKLERGEIAKMRLRQDPPQNEDELARLELEVVQVRAEAFSRVAVAVV